MNPFKLIARFVRWLWRVSMLIRYPFDSGLRIGSRVAGLYMFLVLFFLSLGLVLVTLGFDLDALDRSVDAQAAAIDWTASMVFRIVSAAIFLLSLASAVMLLLSLLARLRGKPSEVGVPDPAGATADGGDGEEPAGAGSLGCGFLIALAIAYFAWFGIVG